MDHQQELRQRQGQSPDTAVQGTEAAEPAVGAAPGRGDYLQSIQRSAAGPLPDASTRESLLRESAPSRSVSDLAYGAPAVMRSAAGQTAAAEPGGVFSRAMVGGGEVPYRADMERSFGHDFSGVKSTVGRSAEMGALGAHAAAQGEQISFASHNPSKELVAHELTHVVQQRQAGAGAVQGKGGVSDPAHDSEREADEVAPRAARGERVAVTAAPTAATHRKAREGDEIDHYVKGGIARHHLENLNDEAWQALLKVDGLVKGDKSIEEINQGEDYKKLVKADAMHAPMILAGLFKIAGRDLNKQQKAFVDTYDIMNPDYKVSEEDKKKTIEKRQLKPEFISSKVRPRPNEHFDVSSEQKPIFETGKQNTVETLIEENLKKSKQSNTKEFFEGLSEDTISKTQGMDKQERAGIEEYTSKGYLDWAATLKEMDPEKLEKDLPKIKLAVSGIHQLPVYQGECYRGEDKGKVNYKEGETVGFDKFLSTSTCESDYVKKKTVKIHIKGVKTGRDVRLLSTKNAEMEVLFAPGARFLVEKVEDSGKKITLSEA